MDTKSYLQSFGWKEGEALQSGGLKKPLLVQHKKDTKGLGHDKDKDGETWWESLFDGHLKNLEVNNGDKGIKFSIDEEKVDSTIRKKNSPLYRMFIQGEGLAGTVGKREYEVERSKIDVQELFDKQLNSKMMGIERNEKKVEKEKKEKKEKKHENDKIKNKNDKKDDVISKNTSDSETFDKLTSNANPMASRLSARAKYIRQKKASVMDPKLLNEIFMITK